MGVIYNEIRIKELEEKVSKIGGGGFPKGTKGIWATDIEDDEDFGHGEEYILTIYPKKNGRVLLSLGYETLYHVAFYNVTLSDFIGDAHSIWGNITWQKVQDPVSGRYGFRASQKISRAKGQPWIVSNDVIDKIEMLYSPSQS